MLFVIGTSENTPTVNSVVVLTPTTICYVLDTDDLVVEEVSFQSMWNWLKLGVEINNAYIVVDEIRCCPYGFHGCMKNASIHEVSCLNGRLVYNKYRGVLFDGIDLDLRVSIELNSVLLGFKGKCVVTYKLPMDTTRVSVLYAYILNQYIVLKTLIVYSFSTRIVTSIIIDMTGELVDVIPDKSFISEVAVVSKDPSFSVKYAALRNDKY